MTPDYSQEFVHERITYRIARSGDHVWVASLGDMVVGTISLMGVKTSHTPVFRICLRTEEEPEPWDFDDFPSAIESLIDLWLWRFRDDDDIPVRPWR